MKRIIIDIGSQSLELREASALLRRYAVSTALHGAGERDGSGCTPRGRLRVRACIGAGAPLGAVFVGRRATGEIWSPALAQSHPQRDWILTRILWLGGCEPGFNRYGAVDTQRRYIYIHGAPDCEPMGVPRSHGCVRMRNRDVIELFDQVAPGTPVLVRDSAAEP